METGNRLVRTWISLVIAVVFAIAAMPGSMAMPAPKPISHAMAMSHSTMTAMDDCCDQTPAKAPKSDNNPCKDMAVCYGLLSCYGLAALPLAGLAVFKTAAGPSVPATHQSVSGLSIPPDDPPPIAG